MSELLEVVDMCTMISPSHCNKTLESYLNILMEYIKSYPGDFSGPLKDKIESYLIQFLSYDLINLIMQLAGTCFHFLQQRGTSCANKSIQNWTDQVHRLCGTCHTLYDEFLDNMEENNCYAFLDIIPIPFLDVCRYRDTPLYAISTRLKNVFTFLNMFLTNRYGVAKVFNIKEVLDVIQRGLRVDEYNVQLQPQFATLLYERQVDLANLLYSLIRWYTDHLEEFASIISKILIDCLKLKQKMHFIDHSEFQKRIYRIWILWITAITIKISNDTYGELVSFLLLDMFDSEDVQKPKMCIVLLDTSRVLLDSVHLPDDILAMVYTPLLQHLIKMQEGDTYYPYTELKCKTGLYKLLASLLNQPKFCTSPNIQTATSIFVKAAHAHSSESEEISTICARALALLKRLRQPMVLTLQLELSTDNSIVDENVTEETNKSEDLNRDDEISIHSNNEMDISFVTISEVGEFSGGGEFSDEDEESI